MITEPVKRLIENISFVFVATADSSGLPHLAIGEQIAFSGDSLLIFENWFCPATLENIAINPHVTVVAVAPDSGKGFQMVGSVVRSAETGVLNGYVPEVPMPEMPQALTRFAVKVEKVLEFTSGIHSDIPITE